MVVQQTSILAYHNIDDLSHRQQQVLTVIAECGPITNLEIKRYLEPLPINSITGRTNELVKKELVKEFDTKLIRYGNKLVRSIRWNLTEKGKNLYY